MTGQRESAHPEGQAQTRKEYRYLYYTTNANKLQERKIGID